MAARSPWDTIGASGARIVATLLNELRSRRGRYGLATLCLGGGGSVAMAFERAPEEDPMTEVAAALAGGSSSPGRGQAPCAGRTFESRNPRAATTVGTLPGGDVRADVAIGRHGHAETGAFTEWSRTPAPGAASITYALRPAPARRQERLRAALTREMGKVLAEARGDVQEAIDIAE